MTASHLVRIRSIPSSLCLLVLSLLVAFPLGGQDTGTLEGVTTTPEGEALASVQISVEGTRFGALTDGNGRFRLTGIPAGEYTVVAQRIGFGEEEREGVTITAGEVTSLEFQLTRRALELDELIVTGTTEATARANLPFTVSQLTSEDIPIQPRDALSSLAGRTAGVSVVPSGQPGTSTNVMLRTPTSINRSNSPLIVVDGVIVAGNNMDLSTMDIESIEVVKGAAAASLYGSRAGAGVIQIQTTRGGSLDEGRTIFRASSEVGFNEIANPIGFSQHHNFEMDDQGNFIGDDGQVVDDRFLARTTRFGFVDQEYPGGTFDHIDALFTGGGSQTHTFSVGHNAGNTNFLATASRQADRGVVQGHDGMERNDVRLNVDHRPRDDLSIALSTFHMQMERDDMKVSGANVFFDFINTAPDVDLTQPDPDGTPFAFQPDVNGIRTNPLYSIHNETNRWDRTRTMASADVRYAPVSWLSGEATFSYDRSDRVNTQWVPRGIKTPDRPDGDIGQVERDSRFTEQINASFGLTTRRTFLDRLDVRSVLRGLIESEESLIVQAQGVDASVGGIPDLGAFRSQSIFSSDQTVRAEGYFATLDLSWDDRYILNTLVRYDGSSLFGEEERWHPYYRVSGAWRMASESWWPFPNVNEFRLRLSQGTAGGRPNFADRFETFSVSDGRLQLTTLGNQRLKPETTREREFGVDIVTHDRFSFEIVYAEQRTTDQLLNVPLPKLFGFGQQWLNAGTIEGNTLEFQARFRAIQQPNFSWTVGLVGDRSRNRITEFDAPCFTSGQQFFCEGERIGRFVGAQWATTFDHLSNIHSDGVSDHFQVNDDGLLVAVGPGNSWRDGVSQELWGTTVDVEGRSYDWGMPIVRVDEEGNRATHVTGDSNPDLRFGLSNQVRWGNLSFFALVDGQVGGDIENRTQQRQTQWLRSELVDQAGKPVERKKPDTYYVQYLYDGNRRNSWWVEPADHLRLREVSVSYDVDPSRLAVLQATGMSQLTLTLNARNLWTLTKDEFTGWDPVSGSPTNAQESFGFPSFRTLTGKIEIQF